MSTKNVSYDFIIDGYISATRLVSTIATGTAPMTVASTTVVTNLNADLLDGQHGSYYAPATGGNYVPYTGATGNVSLGVYNLSANAVTLNPAPAIIPTTQGSMYFDEDEETLAVILNGTTQKVGEDVFFQIKNQTGVTIPKGTAVRFDGVEGASGRISVVPFLANGTYTSLYFLGVTSEDILDGADGKAYVNGKVNKLNTNAYPVGTILYCSSTVAGGFQTTPPIAPNNIISVAAVITQSTTVGKLLIRPQIGSNINNDEGVKIVGGVTGNLLQLQSNGLWENKTLAQAGIQPTLTNPITGSLTTNYIPKATGANSLGNSQIFDNGTNVGIGTASSTDKLYILSGVQDANHGIRIKRNQGVSGSALYLDTDHLNNNDRYHIFANTGTSGTAFYVTHSGKGFFSNTITALDGNSTNWNTAFSWGNHAGIYDNYSSWNLKTNGVQRTGMASGSSLDIVAGTNMSATYSAGGVVTLASTDTNTWIANSQANAGYIAAGGTNYNMVWATDGAGNPGWGSAPATAGATATLSQGTAATTWTFNHNTGQLYPAVTVYGATGLVIIPKSIQASTVNTLILTFNSAITGTAVAVVGGAGSTGLPGDTPTLGVGTVTTGAAGTSVIITEGGTALARTFNFTIPRGDTGAAGIQLTNLSSTMTGLTYTNTTGVFSATAGYAIPTTTKQGQWDTAYTDRNKWDGGATGLVATTGRASLGGTTVGQAMFTLTNPSAITFPQFNANNTVSALTAANFRTAIGAGTITGTGTTNYIPKFTGANSLGNSQIFDNGTNVGINTTNPLAAFHVVRGSIGATFTPITDETIVLQRNENIDSNAVFTLVSGGTGESIIRLTNAGEAESGKIGYRNDTKLMYFFTNGSEKMRILTNGSTLIGTTTDTGEKLQVNGSVKATSFKVVDVLTAGIITEISGELVNYGTNYNQLGSRDTTKAGGFFRIDTRVGLENEFFNVKFIPANGSEQTIFNLSTAGAATFASTVTASNLSGTNTGDQDLKLADNAAAASSLNVGSQRYRVSGNNSYVDVCMQTGVSTYEWVNIVQNNW